MSTNDVKLLPLESNTENENDEEQEIINAIINDMTSRKEEVETAKKELRELIQELDSKEAKQRLHAIVANEDNLNAVGGYEEELAQIKETAELHLKRSSLLRAMGVEPPKGILLKGHPGTGKTLIAKAVANDTGAFFFFINGFQVRSQFPGESIKSLRKAFEEAEKMAHSIIFIDELDAIAPKRDKNISADEKQMLYLLLTLLDSSNVFFMGATSRPDTIDTAVRRRFQREIEIKIPATRDRLEILRIHTKKMKLADDVDLEKIASETHGLVGSEIVGLCAEAAYRKMKENNLAVTMDNFKFAMVNRCPSVPHVEDIGDLEHVEVKKDVLPSKPLIKRRHSQAGSHLFIENVKDVCAPKKSRVQPKKASVGKERWRY